MHFKPLFTGAIALSLWAPQAAAQTECCESSQKAAPVTVRLLQGCDSQAAKATPVAQPAGFDVTQDEAVRTLAALGYVSDGPAADGGNERGYLGVVMDVADGAMIVRRVMDGSPAAKAGLKAGDRITRLGDHKVKSQESLTEFLQGRKAGNEVELRVVRDGWVKEMEVTLAPLSAIQVDESPLTDDFVTIEEIEEVEESPDREGLRIVEFAPEGEGHGEWLQRVQEGDGEANVWITDLSLPGAEGKGHKIELKGLGGLALLDDVTELHELSELDMSKIGVDVSALAELGELGKLHELGDVGQFVIEFDGADLDLEGLQDRIHAQIKNIKGHDGEHEVEVHVQHGEHGDLKDLGIDLEDLHGEIEIEVLGDVDLDDLKKRIHTRLQKKLGSGSHGAREVEVHVEHDGSHDAKVRRRVIMSDEHGKHLDMEGLPERIHAQIEKIHGHDGAHEIEVHVEHDGGHEAKVRGKVIMIGEDGETRELEIGDGQAHVLRWHTKDGETEDIEHILEHSSGGADRSGNVMFFGGPEGGKKKVKIKKGKGAAGAPSTGFFFSDEDVDVRSDGKVIKRRVKAAPGGDSFIFDLSEGAEDHHDADDHHARDHDDADHHHDAPIGNVRAEIARLREEIARLRSEIRKMRR